MVRGDGGWICVPPLSYAQFHISWSVANSRDEEFVTPEVQELVMEGLMTKMADEICASLKLMRTGREKERGGGEGL